MSVKVDLATRIYPLSCIEAAVSIYEKLCSIEVLTASPTHTIAELTTSSDSNELMTMHEFLNYLLNLSIEHRLGANNIQK